MAKELGQPVLIVSKPVAALDAGTADLVSSEIAPDGYTLALMQRCDRHLGAKSAGIH